MNELVKQANDKDTDDFCDLIRNYEKNIYCYLFRLCGNREDALDLTQETFLKAYANLHRFNTSMDFKPWIYRIAHNNYVNYVKSRREFVDIEWEDIADCSTPESTIISKDIAAALDRIIGKLPYGYKSVFLLRTIDNLHFKEIGSILKITENSARMRYLRVRKKIGEMLKGGNLL